jgi:hypothetical protein
MYDKRRCATLILGVAAAAAACMAVVPSASAAPARPAGGAQGLATGGTWGKAQEVPGTAALNGITSVSCASAGNCSAGGNYTSAGSLDFQAFVVSEVNGTWRKSEEVPGTAALNTGGSAEVTSVSCASAGDCSAGGNGFVVSEVNGTWRRAEEVRGSAAFNKGGARIISLSCASAGHCSAVGVSSAFLFVVSET